jgi:hypothetical protein
MDLSIDPLQGTAVVLGIAGAVLVAWRTVLVRRLGFSCWVVANLLWVAKGIATANLYLTVLFAVYWVTAVAGLVNSRTPGRNTPAGNDQVEIRGDRTSDP